MLFLITILNSALASAFINGTGTEGDPFMIGTCLQLQAIDNTTGYYELNNSIDCTDTVNWNAGAGFQEIPSGRLDGNNWTVYGLYFNHTGGNFRGIMSSIAGSGDYVRNIVFENGSAVFISTTQGMGYLTETIGPGGHVHDIEFRNINISGGLLAIGLVAGTGTGGNITRAYADSESFVHVGSNSAGSFIGSIVSNTNTIRESSSNARISGGSSKGGLVGQGQGGNTHIFDSYFNGTVETGSRSGGFIGWQSNFNAVINRSYSAGSVSGSVGSQGAFIGSGSGETIQNSFWDSTTTGQTVPCGSGCSGVPGNTTAEMQSSSMYTNAGWDFINIWNITEFTSYPYHQWNLTEISFPVENETNGTGNGITGNVNVNIDLSDLDETIGIFILLFVWIFFIYMMVVNQKNSSNFKTITTICASIVGFFFGGALFSISVFIGLVVIVFSASFMLLVL